MYLVFFIFHNVDLATSESEGGICPTENGNIMYKNTDVKEGLEDIQEQFYAYCDIVGSCNVEVGVITTTTVRDYTGFFNNDDDEQNQIQALEHYENACGSVGGSICKVNIDYVLSGQNFVGIMKEINKPICFPSNCGKEDVGLLNPFYSPCDASNVASEGSCDATITSVECPANHTINANLNVNTNSTLASNNNTSTQTECGASPSDRQPVGQLFRVTIDAAMESKCAASTIQTTTTMNNQNEFCTVEKSDAEISRISNFSSFEPENAYSHFSQTCVQKGGLKCEISFNLQITPTNGGIKLYEKNDLVPICIPQSCHEQEDRIIVAQDIILKELITGSGSLNNNLVSTNPTLSSDIGRVGSICVSNPDACDIEVTFISCDRSPAYIEPTNPPVPKSVHEEILFDDQQQLGHEVIMTNENTTGSAVETGVFQSNNSPSSSIERRKSNFFLKALSIMTTVLIVSWGDSL